MGTIQWHMQQEQYSEQRNERKQMEAAQCAKGVVRSKVSTVQHRRRWGTGCTGKSGRCQQEVNRDFAASRKSTGTSASEKGGDKLMLSSHI